MNKLQETKLRKAIRNEIKTILSESTADQLHNKVLDILDPLDLGDNGVDFLNHFKGILKGISDRIVEMEDLSNLSEYKKELKLVIESIKPVNNVLNKIVKDLERLK